MKKKFLLLLLFIPGLMIAQEKQKDASPFYETQWVLKKLNEKEIKQSGELMPFIIFTNDSVIDGFTGCNKLQGKYQIKGGKLEFQKISATKMKCEEHRQESELIRTIEKSDNYKIQKNVLTLKSKGKPVAQFEELKK